MLLPLGSFFLLFGLLLIGMLLTIGGFLPAFGFADLIVMLAVAHEGMPPFCSKLVLSLTLSRYRISETKWNDIRYTAHMHRFQTICENYQLNSRITTHINFG